MSRSGLRNPGVQACLLAALLFGAGTPAAKLLLDSVSPWMLAGLLYTGSGVGLGLFRLVMRSPRVRLPRADRLPLAGAVVFGGIIGPVLLMLGLINTPATGASLLLNAEAVFTALLAWFVFKENFDRRILLGLATIVAGAIVITVPAGVQFGSFWPSLAILGACLCWGIDNNFTRKVALNDASWLAAVKGLAAGPVNLILAFALGSTMPPALNIATSMLVGFFAYGISLVLFIVGLRHVGTARAGAYFSVAPFFGALLAIALGEPITWPLTIAAGLMLIGVWLHLRENHHHQHTHHDIDHDHFHTHNDLHHDDHDHTPESALTAASGHRHHHHHHLITHEHEHFPDIHHRHRHDGSTGPPIDPTPHLFG